ncbi:MAG TPA: hypothetical protein VKX45_22140 [Bryobacteraceae bacterium]|jgi:hypothetical protein|nr:hypothetical protein [Bryobacteraceae bacterium]
MPKNRFSALLSVLLVFSSGVLVGVVGHRLYTVNSVTSGSTTAPTRPPRPDPEEVRRRLISEMRDKVKLDDQQLAQLNRIYDQTRQRFDELHKKGSQESRALWEKQKEEIRAILRPDQIPLYDKYQKERDEQRHRNDKQRKETK